MRQMLAQRRIALWLADELGESTDSFLFRIQLSEKPEAIGQRLREALGVSAEAQLKWRDEFQAWRVWREAVERLNVLVVQFSNVPLQEVRGVSVLEFPAPVIGINIKEITASKPFTLIHELVHLGLANASEELPAIGERRPEPEWMNLERFAEEVTGAALLPKASLSADPTVSDHNTASSWSFSAVRELARRYKVTPLAMITRLLRIGKCSPSAYRQWRIEWEAYLQAHPPKAAGGIATPAQKAVNRHGQPFTRLVLEALTRERITSLEAARYLNLRYPHVEMLRRDLLFALPMYSSESSGAP